MMIFANSLVDIWLYGPGDYRIVIKKNHRLVSKLNRVLKNYPADTVFTKEDEPLFKFSGAQIESIKLGAPKLAKILTQIKKEG